MKQKFIPKAIIERVPLYLGYLDEAIKKNVEMISSKTISVDLGLGEVQVRKDLNIISGNGRPKVGYKTIDLRKDLESLIRETEKTNVVIVGAGKIGEALANYSGFEKNGFNILAAFDKDESKIGKIIYNKSVLSINNLKEYCIKNSVEIIMLAVPSSEAQNVCDMVKGSHVKGILNFTKRRLEVENDVCVRNVDMASLLVMLAVEINNNLNKGE